jgi:hypothetical protein
VLDAPQEVTLVLVQVSVVDWGIVMLLEDAEIVTVGVVWPGLAQAPSRETPNKKSANAKIFFMKSPKPAHQNDTEFPTYPSRWARDYAASPFPAMAF